MKRYFQSKILTMFILFFASALASVLIYPEVFIYFKTSFVLWQDYCVEYPLTFVLTNFIYQGGLQLWDFFGQMPLTYEYASFGLFKLPNVMSAIAYYVFSPFSQDSSQFYHHIFTWGNMGTLLFIRVVGIFLLLQTVTRNRIVLTLGTVVFSVFFCQVAFMRGTFYLSYYPLGMYFIVRFFQELRWQYLAATVFFLAVVMGSSVVCGGCLYLPIHFFIISGILWKVFFNSQHRKIHWDTWDWKKAAWIFLAVLLILAPYAYIVKFCLHDLAFGQSDSRITHLFSPLWYFQKLVLALGDPRSFFSDNLNYLEYQSYFSYIGWSFLFLAMAGFILSRNTLKWLFALTVLFIWLLSFPRENLNIGLIAHLINALTNPLKTLPRSYYASDQGMFAFLLMPLAVLGIEALGEIYSGKRFSNIRIGALCAVLIVFGGYVFSVLPSAVRSYLTACTILVVCGLGWVQLHNSVPARRFLTGIICSLVIIDVLIIIDQSKTIFAFYNNRLPVVLDAAPQAGMVAYDNENPSIFPYRYSYLVHFSYRDENLIWFPRGVSSDLHHVINQGLSFTYINGHNQRHAAFENWLNDPPMFRYLMNNKKFIFLADEAINASGDALGRITDAGLERQVAMVDDPGHILHLPDQWTKNVLSKNKDEILFSTLSGPLIKIGSDPYSFNYKKGDLILFSLTLPDTFPKYLATSWFAEEERYLHFFVEGDNHQWQEFQHAQGELIRPYTFDVQNIKEGTLTAAFPKDDFLGQRNFILYYPSKANYGVTGLWRRQFDNLGIIFNAQKEGWLVCHYPYDTKFRISVDGREVQYYRTNKSFIGFPLASGEHKILFQYWPQTALRFFLLLSAIITTIGLPLLIFLGLNWEQKRL